MQSSRKIRIPASSAKKVLVYAATKVMNSNVSSCVTVFMAATKKKNLIK